MPEVPPVTRTTLPLMSTTATPPPPPLLLPPYGVGRGAPAATSRARESRLVPRTQAVTILFCDLVSSTERRARLGDDAFDEFTGRFLRTLRAAIADAGGREVKSAGDGLMVVFPESVADAIACATAMHRTIGELDPQEPPRLRIGISCGEVAQDGDDYAGMPIV